MGRRSEENAQGGSEFYVSTKQLVKLLLVDLNQFSPTSGYSRFRLPLKSVRMRTPRMPRRAESVIGWGSNPIIRISCLR